MTLSPWREKECINGKTLSPLPDISSDEEEEERIVKQWWRLQKDKKSLHGTMWEKWKQIDQSDSEDEYLWKTAPLWMKENWDLNWKEPQMTKQPSAFSFKDKEVDSSFSILPKSINDSSVIWTSLKFEPSESKVHDFT